MGTPPEPPAAGPSIPARLRALTLPIMGMSLLGVVTLLVDTMICGRLPDAEVALSALAFSLSLLLLIMVAMLGLSIGATSLIARANGAGDHDRINKLLLQSTLLTVVVGVTVGAVLISALRPLFGALGATPEVTDAAIVYLRPMLAATPLSYLVILYNGVLRGLGNTRLPFVCSLAANVVNAVLSYGLALGAFGLPALGIIGTAIGSVICYAVNVALLIVILRNRRVGRVHLPLRPERIDWQLARELYRVGTPAAIELTINYGTSLALIGLVGRIDAPSVAAHGIGTRIAQIAMIPAIAISMATAAMVGMTLGAGSSDRARQVVRAALRLAMVVLCALAVALVVAAGPMLRLFDIPDGSSLHDQTVLWIRINAALLVLMSLHVVFVAVLQGSGATGTSLRISLVSTVAIQIPAALLLAYPCRLGVLGVWLSPLVGMAAKVVLELATYRRGRWAVTGSRLPAAAPPHR